MANIFKKIEEQFSALAELPSVFKSKRESEEKAEELGKKLGEQKSAAEMDFQDIENSLSTVATVEEAKEVPILKEFSELPREERIEITKKEAEKAKKEAEEFSIAKETAKGAFRQIGDMVQSMNRNIVSVGLTIAKRVEKDPEAKKAISEGIFDLTEVSPFLFGSEKVEESILEAGTSPRPLGDRIATAELEIKNWAKDKDSPIKKFAFNNSKPIATTVILGMAGLDLTPFGGLEKNVAKQVVKTTTRGGALRLLKKSLKVTDDIAERFADDIVKVADEKSATNLLRKIAEENQLAISKKLPLGVKTAKNIPHKDIPVPPQKIFDEPTEKAIDKLTKAIKDAVPLRKEQEKLFAGERARRVAKAARVGERVEGERGFFAQLAQLKGELPKKSFEAVRKQFGQDEIDTLFNAIERTNILTFEKITAKGGLAKLFEGVVPTKNEIRLLKEIFPSQLVNEILKKRPMKDRILEFIGQVVNIPRAIMTSIDLSAPLRQGIFLIGRPKQFVPSFGNMFKYAFSEAAYEGLEQNIRSRPTYTLMRKAKISFTELGSQLVAREESIMSNLPERIPLLGKVFRGSNRAYTGFLNKLRADVFDDIIIKSKSAGKELSDDDLISIGKFINSATGRGSLGELERAAVVMNSVFFSPRLIASRVNLLNPYFYVNLSPVARKEAVKSFLSFTGIAGTVLGLMGLSGAEIGTDPRSADFLKAKVGNTRYDVLGGFQQYARMAGQLISGEIISSTTGRTLTVGEGYKPLTRKDILLRFFENKESPIASFITAWLTGTTFTGEDFDIPTEIINRFIPMVVQDIYDLSQERGAEGILMGLPAIFGVGVQTYGKQELVFGENILGEETAQVRPVPELAEKIREAVFGQLPLGTSKTFSVEAYYDQLSNLPREEAADIFDKIAETNPELAKKILDVAEDREKGITVKDKDLKAKGVASGDRALAIQKEFNKLKSDEEKEKLWDEYVEKGIITKEVARQLDILFKNIGEPTDDYDRNIFGIISDYTRAFFIDPQNAFKALFTKEKLGVVQGNLVELQRFYGIDFNDEGGSQEYKKELMEKNGLSWEDRENWKLEHIVPVKAGGSSSEDNLMLVNNELHDFFTPIDIAVGNAVKEGRITRKRAEEIMYDFKVNKKLTAEEVISEIGG